MQGYIKYIVSMNLRQVRSTIVILYLLCSCITQYKNNRVNTRNKKQKTKKSICITKKLFGPNRNMHNWVSRSA